MHLVAGWFVSFEKNELVKYFWNWGSWKSGLTGTSLFCLLCFIKHQTTLRKAGSMWPVLPLSVVNGWFRVWGLDAVLLLVEV